MKVLFYIHSLTVGGAETIVVDYLLNLKNAGISVYLVENTQTNSFLTRKIKEAEIPIIDLFPDNHYRSNSITRRIRDIYFYHFANYTKLWQNIIKEVNPDIIHFHTSLRLVGKVQFSPRHMVYTFHSNVERDLSIFGKKHSKKLHQLSNNGLCFFSLSNRMTTDILNEFKTKNIFYVPNGIDINRIKQNLLCKEEARRILGVKNDSFVVAQIGRIVPVKNQEKAINVYAKIHERIPNSYLLIIGSKQSEYYQKVYNLVQTLGLKDNVIFLGIRDDIHSLFNGIDAIIHPSFNESFSLVALEAQVAGVKTIVSNAVPAEVVCTPYARSMSVEESDSHWADALLDSSLRSTKNDVMHYDIHNIIADIIHNYKTIAERN